MRIFISVLVLIFNFQSWTKADDIRDFEIEGISVGDSLLDFASEKKIKSAKAITQYPNNKYTIYEVDFVQIENYEYMGVTTKTNDKKYITTSVFGVINFDKLDECLDIKNSIMNYVEKNIKFDDKDEVVYSSKRDKTGNSKVYGTQYYFKPYPSVEAININCFYYTEESGFQRNLKVSANEEDYAYFLINEAYK